MPTELPAPGDPRAFYVIDLSGYIFRAYHALPPMSSSRGEPTHAIFGVTRMLLALIRERRPAHLAVALDSPDASFRKARYPEYKANRPPPPEDLRPQIERLKDVIDAYRIEALGASSFEADDVIATAVRRAKDAGLVPVIVSSDKDLLQLVSNEVVLWDPAKERVFGIFETIDKLGVPPRKVRDYLALVGDSSDNVPGVRSVGPKTALALLSTFEDLDAIYGGLDGITRKATRTALEQHRADAYLSRELVTLREDAPIALDLTRARYDAPDADALRKLFGELEFHELLSQLGTGRVAPPVSVTVASSTHELAAALEAARASGALAFHTLLDGEDAQASRVVGVAVVTGESEAVYAPIGHLYLGAPRQLDEAVVGAMMAAALERSQAVCADTKREMLLWSARGGGRVRPRFDAMLASYLVDPERHGHAIEEVARGDLQVDLEPLDALVEKKARSQKRMEEVEVERAARFAGTRALAARAAEGALRPRLEARGLMPLLTDVELPLAAVLADMERVGVSIDVELLARLSKDAGERIAALDREAQRLAGHPFAVGSPRALETVLFDELGLRVVRRTKTGRSTDHETLEELADEHPLPRVILEQRSLAKLKGTYLDALPLAIDPRTGRVHTRFNQAVAATGRMSSSEPNLQNIPVRTEDGRAIRGAFVAASGFRLLSADYSQIELRLLAHLSGDRDLCAAFADGEDVHARTASAIFEVPEAEVTREQRGQAKTVNYAVIYGQSQFALARNLKIEKAEAKRYIDAFFARYAGVASFLERTVEQARATGGVRTLLGRWRGLPDIRSKNHGLRSAAERVARNTPIQGSAADLLKIAMVRIHRDLAAKESRMLLTVHDELLFEVREGEEDAVSAMVKRGMEQVMELSVPLVVDVGLGRTWAEVH